MKRISKSKQKGLSKLPEGVVNKMGFTKENMKAKYGTSMMMDEAKYGKQKMLVKNRYRMDMSEPMVARMRMGEEVPMTSAAYGKMEKAMYGKSVKKGKGRYGVSMQTPGKKK